MTYKLKMDLIERVKRRTCPNCADKKGIPANINGTVVEVERENNPCDSCEVTKLERLLEADR